MWIKTRIADPRELNRPASLTRRRHARLPHQRIEPPAKITPPIGNRRRNREVPRRRFAAVRRLARRDH
jgi:hypothetical protein